MPKITLVVVLLLGAVTHAEEKRPTKIWNRTGPLGDTPKHVTDAYPLSDQQNKGQWVKFEPMTDEFDGKELDRNKWLVGMDGWKGRQPALFSAKNVTVSDGKLHLTMRKEKLPAELGKQGYHDYTSAALHSKDRTAYGYFEVKAKPMNSAGSSSFWFDKEDTPNWVTEIDVFEIGGNAKGFENRYNMNPHVIQTPQEKKHWSVGGVWKSPWRLADDFHVYGLEWNKDEIKYYVDGVVVRSVENTHWHQPLLLTFDSETMPGWMGMPKDEDLPSTFSDEGSLGLAQAAAGNTEPRGLLARPSLYLPFARLPAVSHRSACLGPSNPREDEPIATDAGLRNQWALPARSFRASAGRAVAALGRQAGRGERREACLFLLPQ